MERPKGEPNKLTAEVKDKLHLVMDNVVSSLNISTLTTDQKIKDVANRFAVPIAKTEADFRRQRLYRLPPIHNGW